jgi:plastocyanin
MIAASGAVCRKVAPPAPRAGLALRAWLARWAVLAPLVAMAPTSPMPPLAPIAPLALLALAAVVPGQLLADEIHGQLELLAKDGKGPARGTDPRQAVVYFEPATPGHPPKPPDTPFQLATRKKEFFPHVLPVPLGSLVQFPNQDPILHNVFSVSPGNAFDLGIYRTGPPKEKRFEQAGLVRVYCNVHQEMVAYILVLDTPYYVSPAADGSFRLSGLPKGPGKLTVWHEQADPWSTELTLPQTTRAAVAAKLVVVRPKLPAHLNKTGGAYSRGDDY